MNDQPAATREALVLHAMAEGVIAVDAAGRVVDINPAAERLTGWPRAQALGRSAEQVFRVDELPESAHPVRECLRTAREAASVQPATLLPAPDGHRLVVRWRALPDPDGGAVLLFEDVTQRTLLAQELAYRSQHDALTGLLNREEFEHRLNAALADARENGRRYRVCYVDLDQFQLINDTAGQFAGDEMLREAAVALRARLRDGDVLARLSGDKFGLLLADSDPAGTRALLESLQEAIRALRFQWDENSYSLTLSAGAAPLTAETQSVSQLMREADSACQTAKDEGRDRVHYADAPNGGAADHSMMGRFSEALKQNRFVLFAEDVVDIREPSKVVYREILVRWRDQAGLLIMPGAFVRAAERYFLIGAMDRWVLQAALKHLATQPDDGVIHAVNLSGQSLGDGKFLDYVLEQLRQTGVAPGRLCLEITETAAISRLSEAVRFMRRLTEAGVRFSLDDFGTGMASFAYLKNLPVHFIKIDGSFVHSILDNAKDRGMVEAINRIGHEMGLRTIAESVESMELLKQLREIGVDLAQGRAIAAGRPLADI